VAEHAELLETAFVDYLLGISPSPWDANLSGTIGLRIFPGENNLEKDGACILCYCSDLTEDIAFSGNRWADFTVELKTPFNVDPDDPDADLLSHQANAAALSNAINDTTLIASLNSSSLLVYSITEKSPHRSQDESSWVSGWSLKVYSCKLT